MDSFIPKSSFIQKAEYDEQSRSMILTFKSGSQYKYLYIFGPTWLSFKTSPDHSSYYSRAIKGKLMGVPVIKQTIGKQRPQPLKSLKQRKPIKHEHALDAGLDRIKRINGLIPQHLRKRPA